MLMNDTPISNKRIKYLKPTPKKNNSINFIKIVASIDESLIFHLSDFIDN